MSITAAMMALVASHLVEVRSSSMCPSSQDIADRLRPLLPAKPTQGSSTDIATVETVKLAGGAELHIRLVRDNGFQVGDRRALVPNDCAEAAAMAAAVIAIWETEPLPSAMPSQTALVPSPATAGATSSPGWRLLVGVGGGAGFVGGVAWVGRLEAIGGKSLSRLQGRLGITAETTRSLSLPPGSVAWRHTAFDAGVLLRTLHPVWSWSLDAGLALGWATLQGRGFSKDAEQSSFEYGAVAAVRLALSLGHWNVWAEGRAYGWVLGQRASFSSGQETSSADLPLLDMTTSVGLSAPIFW